jgi:hypothetical protein
MASGVRLGPGKADRERAARSVRRRRSPRKVGSGDGLIDPARRVDENERGAESLGELARKY